MVAIILITGCRGDDRRRPGTDPVEQPAWIVGADISLLTRMLSAGAVYKDSDGRDIEVMSYFRQKGFNYVRLRLFVNPDSIVSCQDLPYVQDMILKAKEKVQRIAEFSLFRYLGRPGKQYKPALVRPECRCLG